MKINAISVLLIASCLAGAAHAQKFIDDLDRISQVGELAKQCEALSKSGGTDERCRSAASIQKAVPTSQPTDDKRPVKQARAATYTEDIDVISYTSAGNSASIDAVVENRVHRMRVGDTVSGWRLAALTEYEATFQSEDKNKKRLAVAFRMPPAAPAPAAGAGVAAFPGAGGFPGMNSLPGGPGNSGFPGIGAQGVSPPPSPIPGGMPGNMLSR